MGHYADELIEIAQTCQKVVKKYGIEVLEDPIKFQELVKEERGEKNDEN